MPYSSNNRDRTHRRILDSAAKLFAANGFDRTSIEDVMAASHLTRGAFYAHFQSKAQLYREAMAHAQATGTIDWMGQIQEGLARSGADLSEALAAWGFLVADAASTEPDVRAAYEANLRALVERFQADEAGDPQKPMVRTALLIGTGVVLASVDNARLRTRFAEVCRRELAGMQQEQPAQDIGEHALIWASDCGGLRVRIH